MAQPDQVSDGINTEQASAARIYDYLLGGSHNFAVDREVAHQAMALVPDLPLHAQANRAFLHRAVQYLIGAGVRQFLDIGSGVPTLGNVHEVAQKADPHSRVVYVDMDPVAVAHSQAILTGNHNAGIIQEDMRRPERLLAHPRLRELLDLDRPVAVLMVAILHAVADVDDPWRIVRVLRDALPSGSYLVVAHGTSERIPEQIAKMVELSARTPTPMSVRGRAEVTRFFDGFDLVEPGVVFAPQWHPERPEDVGSEPERSNNLVGVGRKP